MEASEFVNVTLGSAIQPGLCDLWQDGGFLRHEMNMK
jgi:hypothetical protein